MKNIYTLLCALLISNFGYAQILTFDFDGLVGSEATANSNFNNTNISNSTISRGSGLTAANNGNRFNATGWTDSPDIETAVTDNDYMEFTVTPDSGFDLNISSLEVNIQRSGTGPREVILRSSLDGFVQNLGGSQSLDDTSASQIITFTFNQNNISTPITYRFYMRAESDGGSGGFEGTGNDITVNGSVVATSNDTSVQFTSTSASVAEGIGTYSLEFSITNEDAVATTFDVVLTSGDVSDIEFYTTETVMFPGGSSANETVVVTVTDDGLNEAAENFEFQIQNVSGGNNASVGVNDTFTLTIEANDAPPVTEGWQIINEDTEFTIDFDNTVSNVNIDAFNGSGIVPSPTSGRLDSNAFRIVGLSSNPGFNFGDIGSTDDFARGSSTGGVGTGGVYAFETESGNAALGIQPGGSDFTPGSITLKSQNQTGEEVTQILVEYTIYTYNDQDSSISFDFAWSDDDITFIDAPTLNFTTPETASGSPEWVSETKSILLEGLSISDTNNFYLRWLGDDAASGGSRDEIAIDDIKVTFNPSVATPVIYTYDGSSWSPSDPNGIGTSIDNIIINAGNPTLSVSTTVNDINVESGAAITIDAEVNVSEINLESTSSNYSSLIITESGVVNGTVNYARYTNQVGTGVSGGNDLISAPAISNDASFSNFLTYGLPNNASKLATNGSVYAFGPYDNDSSSPSYVNFATDASTNLEAGVGYRAATTSGETIRFSGDANTLDVSVPVASPINGSEWNLIGNPYPSYVSASAFLNPVNTDVMDSEAVGIYGYNNGQYTGSAPTTGNFTIINMATLNLPGENFNIAPGQGFFIASNDVGGSIEFNTTMQTADGSDDYISNRNSSPNYLLKLNLIGEEVQTTSFYFDDNSSLGLDVGYDAAALNISTTDLKFYSHLVEENSGRPMTLQALNISDLSDLNIPLGVNMNQGEQITISIEDSNIPESINVYLEDAVENAIVLLNDTDYSVTSPTTISGTGRFYLRFSEDVLSTIENDLTNINVFASNSSQQIIVSGQLQKSTTFELHDIQGRRIMSSELNESELENRVNVSTLSDGVYIVTIKNNTVHKSQKVIIK
ncbi:T9SS type A sorting domain-containing protein [Psychroserpens mesophilus]|uniref:T9SS type A sorting domain-containing protein n=1 Tax=Psychroserpens mesophilus TaxID=325473 RepID=UPI003D661013